MFITTRTYNWATTVSLPPAPLYAGTRLTEAVKAAITGSKQWNTAVYSVPEGKEIGDDDATLILTAPHRPRDPEPTWHDKAAEAECKNRGIVGLEEKKSKTAPT